MINFTYCFDPSFLYKSNIIWSEYCRLTNNLRITSKTLRISGTWVYGSASATNSLANIYKARKKSTYNNVFLLNFLPTRALEKLFSVADINLKCFWKYRKYCTTKILMIDLFLHFIPNYLNYNSKSPI